MKQPKGSILFLSYYFPPLNAVACLRTWALAKHLSRLGWQMRVVTPRADFWAEQDAEPLQEAGADLLQYLRTGYYWPYLSSDTRASRRSILGKLGRHIGWRLQMRFGWEPMVGWYHAAWKALRRLERGSVDLVLASGWPFSSFSLARLLARRHQCPFVVDYRDLWTASPFAPWYNTARHRSEEARVLTACSAVTTTSVQSAQIMKRRCGPGKVHVVTNGYHADRLSQVVPKVFSDQAIVYAGVLYPPLRTLDPILHAMADILASKETDTLSFRLHYYGPDGKLVVQRANEIGVAAWLVDHGNVSRQESLAAVAGAHMVVVVNSVREAGNEDERGVVPGKVFEALGLGKRILVVAPEGSDVESIVGLNGRCFRGGQTKEIACYLEQSTSSGGTPSAAPSPNYSWERLASNYDAILTEVKASGAPSTSWSRSGQ
jgi:glycosyltransferase involved in cell wall biosynthesis